MSDVSMEQIPDLGRFVDWVWNLKAERDQLRAEADQFRELAKANGEALGKALGELEAIRGQAPFWYAVISERATVIDKAIRREDVAMEYAEKASATYNGVELVQLYRLPPQHPDAVSVPRELLESLLQAEAESLHGQYEAAMDKLRALLTTKTSGVV